MPPAKQQHSIAGFYIRYLKMMFKLKYLGSTACHRAILISHEAVNLILPLPFEAVYSQPLKWYTAMEYYFTCELYNNKCKSFFNNPIKK